MLPGMSLRHLLGASLLVAGLACNVAPEPDPMAGRDAGGRLDGGPTGSMPLPAFALRDTNATSTTSGQEVSPRDFLERVSGWYFTHAS